MTYMTHQDPFRPETHTMDISYDAWPSGAPYDWSPASREGSQNSEWDNIDFHLDLGCGTHKKARIGLDRYPALDVDIAFDLERFEFPHLEPRPTNVGYQIGQLPFPDSSIKSIISHHCFEHIGENFIPLVDDIYRVLEPGGVLRAITPLFPSHSAQADPDHKRMFMDGTWDNFCGTPGDAPNNCWLASFSVPYTKARFEKVHQDLSPRSESPYDWWTAKDAREIRVALIAQK